MAQANALVDRVGYELSNARLESLSTLGVDFAGRRVFCLGADEPVVQYFLAQGCKLKCSDVTADRLACLKERFPTIDTRVVSLEGNDLDLSGTFDIGYCAGLHNAYSPPTVLSSVAAICGFCVLVDGYVLDSLEPEVRVADDEFGHRYCISLPRLIETFRQRGYPSFYVPRPKPSHEHYRFKYLNDGAVTRDGRPLRQMLLASRAKLESPHLQEVDRGDILAHPDWLERLPVPILHLLVNRNYRPGPLKPHPGWFVGATSAPPPDRVMADRLWRVLRLKTENQGEVVIHWYLDIKLRLTVDDEIAKCVFVEGTFEPTGFWMLDRLLQHGMTFVDAGANFGLFTLFASRKVGKDGLALAFEPSRREFDKLTANVKYNHMSNVRLFRDALGAKAGTARLLVARMPYAGHNTLGRFAYDSIGLEREEEVQLRTLDDVVSTEGIDRVDLIKMDVEGSELSVLTGALKTIRRKRSWILMELSDRTLAGQGSRSAEILAFLHASAYKIFEYTKTGFVQALPGRVYDGSNVIAIPTEYVTKTLAALGSRENRC